MPLLIACSTAVFGRRGARAAIENVRASGLTHIALPIATAGEPSPFGDEPLLTSAATSADVRLVARMLETQGVQVASCDVTSGNPLDPAVVELIEQKLELARQLGVAVVVGEAGGAGDPGELAQLFANLRRIGDAAARCDIVYCCDVAPGLCMNHRWMLKAMADLDHPHLRLNFDPGKLLLYNPDVVVEIALAKVCHLVRHVSLKDFTGDYDRPDFPALGYGGTVDFLRIRQILRDCGFVGPYTICVEGAADDPPVSLEQSRQRLNDSLQTLREAGYFNPS